MCDTTYSDTTKSVARDNVGVEIVTIEDKSVPLATIREAAIRSVAMVASLDPSEVTDEASLESLAVDSFMLTEVLVELEVMLDLELPAVVLAQVERHPPATVGDIVTCFQVLCNS
jgi:acyl carrier protein